MSLKAHVARCRDAVSRIPVSGIAVASIVVVVALADLLTLHDPIAIDLANSLAPPLPFDGATLSHPLGTDELGRDMLSRILVGSRTSLGVASVSIAIAGSIGVIVGLLAGYMGGIADAIAMRATDVMLTFPTILLALVFAVAVGPSFWVVVSVLTLTLWARFARLVRGEVLVIREKDFVQYARVLGSAPFHIAFLHLLPNVLPTIVVLATLHVGYAVILEASLSFLGAGVPPPAPTLGGMISAGRTYMESAWWIVACPSAAMISGILVFNVFGDWVRDALNPKLRQL